MEQTIARFLATSAAALALAAPVQAGVEGSRCSHSNGFGPGHAVDSECVRAEVGSSPVVPR